MSGSLRILSSDIQAGVGPGPLLPVRALSEVEGEVVIPEGPFRGRGLLVHERR